MAVPRFLLPQGQGCDTQPATVELTPAWCLEILPCHWIPSWNTGLKGLWTAADKLKLGGFFFSFLYEHKELFFLAVVFLHRNTQQTEIHRIFPREEAAVGNWECCVHAAISQRELFSHPSATVSSKTNYFLLLLLFPRRKVFFPIFWWLSSAITKDLKPSLVNNNLMMWALFCSFWMDGCFGRRAAGICSLLGGMWGWRNLDWSWTATRVV